MLRWQFRGRLRFLRRWGGFAGYLLRDGAQGEKRRYIGIREEHDQHQEHRENLSSVQSGSRLHMYPPSIFSLIR
jgi:hypothetical protein